MIIDVLMPGMTGPELAQRLISFQQDVKLLFTSAYWIEIVNPATQSAFPLITKPFKPAQVVDKISELLGDAQPMRSSA